MASKEEEEIDVPPQLRRLMAEAMGLDESYIRIMEGPPDQESRTVTSDELPCGDELLSPDD
jgi:hypothetical protein